MRPYPWRPADRYALFLDYTTGRGVDSNGDAVRAVRNDDRRKTASIADLLDTARHAAAGRVYLTGARPPTRWLVTDVAGWSAGRHHFDSDTPVGRFTHDDGWPVELRRAAEWFGDGVYSPSDAADAFRLLRRILARPERVGGFGDSAGVLASPSATGLNLWVATIPGADNDTDRARRVKMFGGDDVPQLDDDLAAELRATTPQHRQELLTATEHRAECAACVPTVTARKLDTVHYLDGRMMYAALVRELGCAPAQRMTAEQATDLFYRNLYTRARYRVRFTVPAEWSHVGVLMERTDDDERWHAPNAPGYVGETWCDAAELYTALVVAGWRCDILGGIGYTKGDPLGRWSRRLVKLWQELASETSASATVVGMVRDALRAMLLYGIGGFHAHTMKDYGVTANPREIPDSVRPDLIRREGDLFVWRDDKPITGRGVAYQHPEWSSQVWGRAHARLLDAPTADRDRHAGVLHVEPSHVVALYGDAVYLTDDPAWPDDGTTPGYFRTKGVARNVTAPTTEDARRTVRDRAERMGNDG